jgi:two-component system, sensor histidine kinase PdtaS
MLCEFVELHCPDSPEIAHTVALTVSEAVGNAVRHAYPADLEGSVEVEADVEQRELVVYVRDEGVGMRDPSEDPGLGLGMTIMGALGQLRVGPRSDGPGTQVVLRFRCGS